ncbi:MAG: AraC family transcriptional regulator [Sphingopyxis sp.]|jgi:AraC family transcriptional activator of pyochelin receptor|uniref:helix-turn-helix transcriptional regulator n=1 Tax=Sphingopyxis sp. TaxID=1908224 RepID=UPI0032EAD135
MIQKRSVVISAELTAYIGRGACDLSALPAAPLILGFGDIGEPAVGVMTPGALGAEAHDDLVVLAINRAACRRLFGLVPKAGGRWYLPADLRGIGRAVVAVEGDGEAVTLLRTARSLELLCQLFEALKSGRMVEAQGPTTLSEREIALVAAAHELVLEAWQDKLTVDGIARRFGLGKAKLTQGFRELYRCTVAEAVSERRLEHARQLLAESDLPVAVVGYRSGYTSNASFTRAFARRFGMAPTELRRRANDRQSAA